MLRLGHVRRPAPAADAVPLREHVEALIGELDRRIMGLLHEKDLRDQQRYDAQVEGVRTAMAAAERAGEKATAAADKAQNTERIADDKRFDLLNELRVGVATKEQFEALEKIVSGHDAAISGMHQRGAGVTATWAVVLAVVGLLLTTTGVAIAIIVLNRG